MLRANADTIARVTGGEVIGGDADRFCTGVAIDSRTVVRDNVFVALLGERTDGHLHLREAVDRGASILVLSRSTDEIIPELNRAVGRNVSVVLVEDGAAAIDSLARWHRGRLLCPVIAVTGSSGKTTTKEYIASVLRTRLSVVATIGNRNNELGVPLTILAAGSETGALVLEMGMRGLGQIAELCAIARPTMGVVTNVGTSHIELLGSRESIAVAKGELAEALHEDALLILNDDDEYSDDIAQRTHATVVRYGTSEGCEVWASDVRLDERGMPGFLMSTPLGDRRVRLRVPGRHNVPNALAAAIVGVRSALALDEIVDSLERVEPEPMRMQPIETASGILVLNDAYNANPSSMRAAISTLGEMQVDGMRVAVLGDMAELGSFTELAHFEMGEEVARNGVDLLVAVGPRASRIAEGALAAGMSHEAVVGVADAGEALAVVTGRVGEGDVVLVKASRVMGLESVVEGMVDSSC